MSSNITRMREKNDASVSAFSRLTTVAVKTAASSCDNATRFGASACSAVRIDAQVGQRPGAALAPFEVRADGDLIGERELAIVKRLETPARRRAGERLHAVLSSRSSSRSAWRARVSRDFTVPTATPSENAISS